MICWMLHLLWREGGRSWVWVASSPRRADAISRWSWWSMTFIAANSHYTASNRAGEFPWPLLLIEDQRAPFLRLWPFHRRDQA